MAKVCELDNAAINIAAWYLRRTRTDKEDWMGISLEDVSDDELADLLKYFSGGQDNDECSSDLQ